MKEKQGYIWYTDADVICIPTSDRIKNAELVMESGLALEAKESDSNLPHYLAHHIVDHGNVPCLFARDGKPHFCSLPVKFNYDRKPSIGLIVQSVKLMLALVNRHNFKKIALPRPECGAYGFDWERDIKPLIEPILDDRFVVYNMTSCVKKVHCPVNLSHCCDVCRLRDNCEYVCTDSNCKVRKGAERKVLDVFYRNQDKMRNKNGI